MKSIETLLAQPFGQALGWTLIHFVWQGALVAILFACVRALFKDYAASVRYTLACGAMLLLLALPLATIYAVNFSTAGTIAPTRGQQRTVQLARPPSRLLDLIDSQLGSVAETASDEALPTSGEPLLGHWASNSFSAVLPWLVCGWLAGALLLSVKFMGGWAIAQGLKRRQTKPLSRRWHDCAARLSRQLRMSKPFRLCESALVEVPTVVGWLRPVILVPASLLTGLPAQQVEALLAHELAHVRRHDYLFNLLQTIVETLLFYHPAVWWISRQVRIEREHCCDDLAVSACGDVLVYARALTGLEQMRGHASGTLALAANGGSLLQRIRRLVATPPPASRKSQSLLAGVMLLMTLCAILAGAQSAPMSSQGAGGAGQLRLDARVSVRQAALTIMSVPSVRVWRASTASLEDVTRKTLRSITANNIPAVGFVGESVLTQGAERQARINLLKMWLDAGLELGNQTYRHMSLYDTPLKDYEANVLNGERVIRPLMKERGMQLRYFSYPFLNTGPDSETKTAFERFLAKHNYQLTPVTIDSMDWLFGQVHDDARRRGDTETMRRVAAEYVPYMERMLEFYEQLSVDVVGYEVPQVLMLTASPLLAEQMDNMIAMMKRRGYSFITLEQALQDKAYAQADSYTGPVGISWLQRWAITKGMGFRKEPPLPPFMQQFDKRSASRSDFKTE